MGDPVSSGVEGVSTIDEALVPAWAASVVPPVPEAVLVSPPAVLATDARLAVSPPAEGPGAGVALAATWDDRAETAAPPEPEPEPGAVGVATALADCVDGLPPESPEMATGSLVETAVASPVVPLLDAEELAVAGPESPVVAVGLVTTWVFPPVPPPDVPVLAPLPPTLGAAKAGVARNRTVAIAAAVATHETIDRRPVVSVITRSSAVEQASNDQL